MAELILVACVLAVIAAGVILYLLFGPTRARTLAAMPRASMSSIAKPAPMTAASYSPEAVFAIEHSLQVADASKAAYVVPTPHALTPPRPLPVVPTYTPATALPVPPAPSPLPVPTSTRAASGRGRPTMPPPLPRRAGRGSDAPQTVAAPPTRDTVADLRRAHDTDANPFADETATSISVAYDG